MSRKPLSASDATGTGVAVGTGVRVGTSATVTTGVEAGVGVTGVTVPAGVDVSVTLTNGRLVVWQLPRPNIKTKPRIRGETISLILSVYGL